MDPYSVNPTLSIFLQTPSPVAMQGLDAAVPWEKDLRMPLIKIRFKKLTLRASKSKSEYKKWLSMKGFSHENYLGQRHLKHYCGEFLNKSNVSIIRHSNIWGVFIQRSCINLHVYTILSINSLLYPIVCFVFL